MLFSWYSGRLTWIPSMAKPSIYALDSGYSGLLKNSALAVTLSWNYPLFCIMFILYCPYWNIILPWYSHLGGKTISWLHIPFNLTYISPLQSPTIFTSKHIWIWPLLTFFTTTSVLIQVSIIWWLHYCNDFVTSLFLRYKIRSWGSSV